MAEAAALLHCCFLLSGTYRNGQTQTSMQQRIFDLGGTVSNKYTPDVTHLLCNDAEFAKRSAKVKAVLAHNAQEDLPRIWIVDQAWLEDTEENQERPLEDDWDLELNLDEEDAEFDEAERQEKAKKAEERKRKREEEQQSQGGVEESVHQGAQVDESCELFGKAHIHTMGNLPMHAYLTQKEPDKKEEKFYIIQILKSDSASMYWVYTRSGRIGGVGGRGKSTLSEPFGQPSVAFALFNKKFKDKTKLVWKDRWGPAAPDAFTVVEPVQKDEFDFDEDFDLDETALAEIDALEAEHAKQPSTATTEQTQENDVSSQTDVVGESREEIEPENGAEQQDEEDQAKDEPVPNPSADEPPAKKARTESEEQVEGAAEDKEEETTASKGDTEEPAAADQTVEDAETS